MDRRLVLMTLAGAAGAAAPAFAQTAAPMSGSPMAGSSMTGMGPAEKDHAMKTAMAGMASLKMADIALEKARDAKVKEFAKFEHDEQTTVSEILKSMDPGMTPPAPDAKTAELIDKLGKMKSSAEFDRDFIKGQTEGHEKLLAIQEDYLKVGKDRETINATKLVRGMVKEHLVLLADLHKMVG